MITKLYSIYDRVSKHYNPPFAKLNDGMATRSIKDAVTQDKHLLNNADDYALYQVGEYDDSTGEINNVESRIIMHIKDLVE